MIKGAAGAHGDPNVIPTYGDIKEIDWSANETIKRCTDVVAFSEIPEVPGMLVWKNGHVGVFIRTLSDGRKLVREAKGHMYGVVETTDTKWIKAGKLPYVDYTTKQEMCTVKLPVLRSGSKGQAVKTLQACLDIEGYGLKIDGSFGPATSKAVIDWKSKNDPKLGSTDEVNTYTWTYLLN